MKESLRDGIKMKYHPKITGIILKSSRRDTTIVNCQFSIVNSQLSIHEMLLFPIDQNSQRGYNNLARAVSSNPCSKAEGIQILIPKHNLEVEGTY